MHILLCHYNGYSKGYEANGNQSEEANFQTVNLEYATRIIEIKLAIQNSLKEFEQVRMYLQSKIRNWACLNYASHDNLYQC